MACIVCNGNSTRPETTNVFVNLAESLSNNANYEKTVQLCTNCKEIWDNMPEDVKK